MYDPNEPLLPCEVVGPDEADKVVIWLHGLGASGHDFVPIVPMLGQPNTRFVFPHAPRQSVTINMGYVMPAWYDIFSLEPGLYVVVIFFASSIFFKSARSAERFKEGFQNV